MTAATGRDILDRARTRVGCKYVLGTLVDKTFADARVFDCAELASWAVFQCTGRLYGCRDNSAAPATADAWTGHWARDVRAIGKLVTPEEAAGIPGAMLLREPAAAGVSGHIVVSDGVGGTVEAMGAQYGVVASTAKNRRWDVGVLAPWVQYTAGAPVQITAPATLRLGSSGPEVRALQQALVSKGYAVGTVDGAFGSQTLAAVAAYQRAFGLTPDGEVGPKTRASLGLT